ncbi:hypothetical protein ACW9I8_20090 [Pseudomonas reactans]
MGFVFGVLVTGLLVFLFLVKGKTNECNKFSRLPFPAWYSRYSSSQMPETLGMARGLILQTFHLAAEFGVLSLAEKKELEVRSMKEDPIQLINGWFEVALPNVLSVIDERELKTFEARLVGVFMLVTLKESNSEAALIKFLQRFNH